MQHPIIKTFSVSIHGSVYSARVAEHRKNWLLYWKAVQTVVLRVSTRALSDPRVEGIDVKKLVGFVVCLYSLPQLCKVAIVTYRSSSGSS